MAALSGSARRLGAHDGIHGERRRRRSSSTCTRGDVTAMIQARRFMITGSVEAPPLVRGPQVCRAALDLLCCLDPKHRLRRARLPCLEVDPESPKRLRALAREPARDVIVADPAPLLADLDLTVSTDRSLSASRRYGSLACRRQPAAPLAVLPGSDDSLTLHPEHAALAGESTERVLATIRTLRQPTLVS